MSEPAMTEPAMSEPGGAASPNAGGRPDGKADVGPLLVVEKLSIELGAGGRRTRVVDEVSFALGEGEVLALAGESGSGKTMTALALVGLLPYGAKVTGSIRFGGKELVGCSPAEIRAVRSGGISIVFQEPMTSLHPGKKVGAQVAEVFRVQERASRKLAWTLAVETLELAGVPHAAERAHQYPHELSGGLQQRVAIAIAIAGRPSIIIADEPTTALDTTVQAQVMNQFRLLREELHVAILFISHDLAIISELCDRIAVMYSGKVIEEGTIRGVFTRPEHPYTEMLLRAVAGEAPPRVGPGLPAPAGEGCAFYPRCPHRTDRCAVEVPQGELRLTDGTVRCFEHRGLQLSGVVEDSRSGR